MLSIGLINNQNYSFKGKINHAQILKEMEELSLKQEEIIVSKIKTQSKAPKKSCFTKINNMIKDFLFNKKFIAPIDTITTKNTYIERYKNGAYKEFDLIPDRLNGDILLKKKEKTPSGIEKIYDYKNIYQVFSNPSFCIYFAQHYRFD